MAVDGRVRSARPEPDTSYVESLFVADSKQKACSMATWVSVRGVFAGRATGSVLSSILDPAAAGLKLIRTSAFKT